MDNLSVSPITPYSYPLTLTKIREVMTSDKISESDKSDFLEHHRTEIGQMIDISISSADFVNMMKSRPLIKFRPLRNSYTKRGDKMILAKSLDVPTDDIDNYIRTVTQKMAQINDMNLMPKEEMKKIKTYVYRHGKKDQVIQFLDYELTTTKDKMRTLHSTLEYNTGGLADYFVRPIHRLDNKTLLRLYNVIDKHIMQEAQQQQDNSNIDSLNNAAQWSLIKLYEIQRNQKIIK